MKKVILTILSIFLVIVLVGASVFPGLSFGDTISFISGSFSPVFAAFDFVSGVVNGLVPKQMIQDPDAVYSSEVYFLLDYFGRNESWVDNLLSKTYKVSSTTINDLSWISGVFNFSVVSSNFHSHKLFSIVVLFNGSYGSAYECFYCSCCDEVCGVRTSPYETPFHAFSEWLYPSGDISPSVGLVLNSVTVEVDYP